jgi:putative inorganic carbon (HCO3(-)) transporter
MDLALGIVILTLPFYLIRLEILSIPTTVLELMIYVIFLIWIIKKVRSQKFTLLNAKQFLQSKNYLTGRIKLKENDMSTCRLRYFLSLNFIFPILLILLGCIISIIVSPNKQAGLGILKGWFIDPLLLFLIISDVIKIPSFSPPLKGGEKEGVIKILSFLAVSGIIAAVAGLFYYFFNELTYDGRLKAFFLSPNHLAMYLAPAGIIALGLFFNFKKYFYLLGFIICSIVIFLTYSYGAWIGFGASILFLIFFFQKKIAWRKKVLLLIIIALLLPIFFFSQRNTEKFQNLDNFSRSSFESRIIIWKSSAAILKDHPFWGIGPGNFQNFYLDYQKKFPPYLEWAVPQPHNLFLAFYLQCGLLGLIGFFWLIFLFFKKGFRGLWTLDFGLWTILLAIMLYILIHGLIDTTYWKNDLSIIFWIVVGLMKIIQDSETRPALVFKDESGSR